MKLDQYNQKRLYINSYHHLPMQAICLGSIMLHSNSAHMTYFMVHYPTRDLQRRLGLSKQGVTIFTITINDSNTEKFPASGSGNMQSQHVPWEPHTNRGRIFFCILPCLNICDFSWLNVYFIVHHPTRDLQRRLGLNC